MNNENRLRMDFVLKVNQFDKETGIIEFILIPDPERYDWKEINKKKALFDKLDKTYIPEDVFEKMIKQMNGLPIYFQPPLIQNSDQYIRDRIPFISEELKGNYSKPTFEDKSEEFLESLEKNKLGFVILSLDIVGSTKLAVNLQPEKYKDIIGVTLFEISSIIPLFHGYILKYTGDGIIAYFPEPSFITKNDLSLDCSLTLRKLIYNGINPILRKFNYPQIDIRIGIESGDAYVMTIGNPKAKQHKDIIGKIVNLAAKIQASAEVGGISLGETTFRNLHINFKKLCVEADLPEKWEYNKENNERYKLYKIKIL